MVKRLLIKLLYEHGGRILNSFFKAYKDTILNQAKKAASGQSSGEAFSFQNLISTPMTREEALKILNLKDGQDTPENIMKSFEKYCAMNEPEKGGSFYVQNKIYYAKEFLMDKYPPELNKKYTSEKPSEKPNDNKEKDELNKNDKI
jgi:import inner membrane translocase subunit TIM16